MSKKSAILVSGLKKSYGELKVLKGIDFSVGEGEIMALLGPNGAGKTTTVNIITTLLKQDAGKAKVLGMDTTVDGQGIRSKIGLTGQFAAVDEYLTGRENVAMIGKLYHLPYAEAEARADELMKKFELDDAADRPVKTYSGGMKRRLDLAMSLVANPPILFLDEPTTGLDPRSRNGLWRMIKDLAKSGTTVLLTTQYMEEAEFLADNVIVIDHGKIIAEGTPNELKKKAGSDTVEVTFRKKADYEAGQKVLKGTNDDSNMLISIPAKDGVKRLKTTLTNLDEANIPVDTASLRRPTLDEVFLALTGKPAEDTKESKDE
jgi:ABC-2 type transport system ATP-binding protein